MKKRYSSRFLARIVVALALLVCLIFTSCSPRGFDYPSSVSGGAQATLSGVWYGVQTEVSVYHSGGRDGDFSLIFLSGSLEGIVISRRDGKISAAMGALAEKEFYDGGLCNVAHLFSPDECTLVRRSSELGILSARAGELEFFVTVDRSGAPASFNKGDDFSLTVTSFSRGK